MKKIAYILFLVIVINSCSNSSFKEKIVELESENKSLVNTIDSLRQLEAVKFNDILKRELGTPEDTLLIKNYENFSKIAQLDFWTNLSNNRISALKVKSSKQIIEKKLFGIWQWTVSDGGWGEDLKTPISENRTQKIVIRNDYTIQYYENEKETKKDSFYLTSDRFLPGKYFTFINLIGQNRVQGFEIVGVGMNERLIFYEPWCQDCPSKEFKRLKNTP